jgi:hypothetical protein
MECRYAKCHYGLCRYAVCEKDENDEEKSFMSLTVVSSDLYFKKYSDASRVKLQIVVAL